MQTPLHISLHGLEPSDALSDLIREHVAMLEAHFPRLVGCRVSVEEPNHHHLHGKGKHFRVCVQMSVPGDTLVADREAPEIVSHEDLYRAVRETFAAATRLLDTHAKRSDGHSRAHPRHKRERDSGQ
jgi:ribosome-associated translation inhibitor RaiA